MFTVVFFFYWYLISVIIIHNLLWMLDAHDFYDIKAANCEVQELLLNNYNKK